MGKNIDDITAEDFLVKEDGGYNTTDHAKEMFEKALKLRKDGDLKEARVNLEYLANVFPKKASVIGILADVCWRLRDLDAAICYFRMATQLSPKSEVASLGLYHTLIESALVEMDRFTSISESKDYSDMKETIRSFVVKNI
jgi:tetratricopeptide (TPR) repeat protein